MSTYGGGTRHPGMVHLNGNLLAVVDVETTGTNFRLHDIWQIAILPLDNALEPAQHLLPFYANMKITRPENMDPEALKVGRIDFAKIQQGAMCPWKAFDLFDEWFKQLNLPIGKKLMPLAHNWLFDQRFIEEWLGGPINYEHYFSGHYRDSMTGSLYINDRYAQFNEKIPLPKIGLDYLGTIFKIKNLKAHDALQDCLQTARIYKQLTMMHMPTMPGSTAPTEE